jgi:simple sugar transport system ATP-binding protein
MVHQHYMLVPSLTVTENILLGLDKPAFRLRLSEYHRVMGELGERFGLRVDPRAKIWQLSVGEQQRVEILKMLYRGVQVLIMDEPTAVLAPTEIENLFETLRVMVEQGKSIIFISHKLQEVMATANRVTVMRKGKVTASGIPTSGTDREALACLMVGREVLFTLEKEPCQPGEVVLQVEDVHAENDKGLPALRGLSLNVHSGEIVGLAGVAGNGRRLGGVITGLGSAAMGRCYQREPVSNKTPCLGSAASPRPRKAAPIGSSPNLT